MNRGGFGNHRGGGVNVNQNNSAGYECSQLEKTYTTVNYVPNASVVPFDQSLNGNMNPISSEKVLVNSYGVKLSDRPIFKYKLKFWARYPLKENDENVRYSSTTFERRKDLSRIPKFDDTHRIRFILLTNILPSIRRRCLTELYKLLFEQHGNSFEYHRRAADGYREHVYAYDRLSIFFCSYRMENNQFEINIDDLNDDVRGFLEKPRSIYATLTFDKPLNLDSPREVETYLDILFSQHQLDQFQRYVKFDNKMFDLQSVHDIGSGGELKDGHQKIANVEEKNPLCNLQIGAKISPFYCSQELLNYIHAKYGFGIHHNFFDADVNGQLQNLKGIYVRTTHKRFNEIFRIHNVSDKPANQITFDRIDRPTNVVQNTNVAAYFQDQFADRLQGGELRFPHFPCVSKKVGGGKLMWYPLEILFVQQGQKLPRDKMSGQQEQAMIREGQRLPGDLIANITNQKNDAHLFDNDQYIRPARIQISNDMTITDSVVLAAPLITYQSSAKSITFAEWDISMVRFVAPATINFLAVFFQPSQQMDENRSKVFANGLNQRASQLGLQIGNFDCKEFDDALSPSRIQAQIIQYRNNYGVDFVIGIADGSTFHHALKSTEIATGIATQQVQPKTINSIKSPNGATMGNIIQKLNLKKGGLNQYFQQSPAAQLSGSIDVL